MTLTKIRSLKNFLMDRFDNLVGTILLFLNLDYDQGVILASGIQFIKDLERFLKNVDPELKGEGVTINDIKIILKLAKKTNWTNKASVIKLCKEYVKIVPEKRRNYTIHF